MKRSGPFDKVRHLFIFCKDYNSSFKSFRDVNINEVDNKWKIDEKQGPAFTQIILTLILLYNVTIIASFLLSGSALMKLIIDEKKQIKIRLTLSLL